MDKQQQEHLLWFSTKFVKYFWIPDHQSWKIGDFQPSSKRQPLFFKILSNSCWTIKCEKTVSLAQNEYPMLAP